MLFPPSTYENGWEALSTVPLDKSSESDTYETMEEEESEGEWEAISQDSGDEGMNKRLVPICTNTDSPIVQQKRDQKCRKCNAQGKAKVKASKSLTHA